MLIFSGSKRMLKILEQMVIISGYNYRCRHAALCPYKALMLLHSPALAQPSRLHPHWLSPAALKSLQTAWRGRSTSWAADSPSFLQAMRQLQQELEPHRDGTWATASLLQLADSSAMPLSTVELSNAPAFCRLQLARSYAVP